MRSPRPPRYHLLTAPSSFSASRGGSRLPAPNNPASVRSSTTSHARHRSSDARRRSSDARHRSSDARHRSSDARHRSSDARHRSSDARRRSSDARRRSSDARHRSSDARHRSSDARHRSSDARHRSSDARHRTSDARRRSSDARHRSSDARHRSSGSPFTCSAQGRSLQYTRAFRCRCSCGLTPSKPERRAHSSSLAVRAEQRLHQCETDVWREPVPRSAVFARISDPLDGGRVAEQVAYARDEHSHAVLGVCALGSWSACRPQDLVRAQSFPRPA